MRPNANEALYDTELDRISRMKAYKTQFLDLALELEVLKFGEFELKSGRVSPYFFNAGLFNSGYAAAKLGRCYASAINAMDFEFDMLFGPAYKGIGLVMLAAAALAEHYDRDYPFAYNRKEAKDHGEGGTSIGAPLAGRVLMSSRPERRSTRPSASSRRPGQRPRASSSRSTARKSVAAVACRRSRSSRSSSISRFAASFP